MDCSDYFRDWAALEYGILGLILNKTVSLYDYLHFSLVCKSWNFIASHYKHQISIITSKVPQLPMLIVPSKDGIEKQHCLYDLTRNEIRPVDFKFRFNKKCCGSSFGWLIMLEETLDITVFNPFSGSVVHLPPIIIDEEPDYSLGRIVKAILTKDPSLYPNDYMVVAIYSSLFRLCLMKANDKSWTYYCCPDKNIPFGDVNVCSGTLYGLDLNMKLYKIEVENRDDDIPSFSISSRMITSISSNLQGQTYVVESSKGELLLVQRSLCKEEEEQQTTIEFVVYKLTHVCEDGTQRLIEVESLDGDAMFLGDSQSTCVSTKDFPQCLPNRIYFTDSFQFLTRTPFLNGPQDAGIFNLEDGSIGEHYITDPAHKKLPHPIWIVPTICSEGKESK